MSTTLLEIPGYRVHGQLGKGGMAEVFLATQESLSRKVAIKVLRPGVSGRIASDLAGFYLAARLFRTKP